MKKLFAMLLALAMALACASGVAETAAEPETWYSLNESEEIVTVRLPANATTGYEWTYEISDPAKLEVVSAEYIPDENRERLAGVGGTYVASFRGTFEKFGFASVKFTYARSFETDGDRLVRTLHLFVAENNQLQVVPWYELSAENKVLTVRLDSAQGDKGGSWLFSCSNDSLELLTMETIENENNEQWVASFASLSGHTGDVSIKIVHIPAGQSDPDDTRELKLTVSDDAALSILCD